MADATTTRRAGGQPADQLSALLMTADRALTATEISEVLRLDPDRTALAIDELLTDGRIVLDPSMATYRWRSTLPTVQPEPVRLGGWLWAILLLGLVGGGLGYFTLVEHDPRRANLVARAAFAWTALLMVLAAVAGLLGLLVSAA